MKNLKAILKDIFTWPLVWHITGLNIKVLKTLWESIWSWGWVDPFPHFQVYIPSSLIVVMSWVSFWLNRGAAPARVKWNTMKVSTNIGRRGAHCQHFIFAGWFGGHHRPDHDHPDQLGQRRPAQDFLHEVHRHLPLCLLLHGVRGLDRVCLRRLHRQEDPVEKEQVPAPDEDFFFFNLADLYFQVFGTAKDGWREESWGWEDEHEGCTGTPHGCGPSGTTHKILNTYQMLDKYYIRY